MLKSIFKTVVDEWSIMINEKMIILVIIIIPLIANLLIGWEFSGDKIQHLPMAVYDQDNSSLSRNIVRQFSENQQFEVTHYVDSSLEMKQLIKNSKVRVGMIIPEGFYKDVVELKSPRILMLYDGSHMPITSAAKSRASEILLTLKTGTLIKLLQGKLNIPETQAKRLALSVQFRNRMLYNPAKSFKNFLNPGLLTGLVQASIALMAASAIRKRDTNLMQTTVSQKAGYLLGKTFFYTAIGTVSLILNVFIQNKVFNIPFRGRMFDVSILSFFLALAVASFALMVSAWVDDKILATQACAVLFIPNTVLVGYTWPVMAMPSAYQTAARFIPFYYYADNLRDMFLKGNTIKYMVSDIQWYMGFSLVIFLLALTGLLFKKQYNPDYTPAKEGEKDVSY